VESDCLAPWFISGHSDAFRSIATKEKQFKRYSPKINSSNIVYFCSRKQFTFFRKKGAKLQFILSIFV